MNDDADAYTLKLKVLPGHDVPGIYRLRRALKYMLRVCGLQCVTIDAEPTAEANNSKPIASRTQSTPNATKAVIATTESSNELIARNRNQETR